MEVHHHTHTSRKKWTHYFWEFLMLFLAVTLGFFVENQREHYIEAQRAKEYAGMLLEDLRKDTAMLAARKRLLLNSISQTDTLINIVTRREFKNIPADSFYLYNGSAINSLVRTGFAEATIEQLKSSGNLRYFSNLELKKKISEYDVAIREFNMREEIDNNRSAVTINYITKLEDFQLNRFYYGYLLDQQRGKNVTYRHSLFDAFKNNRYEINDPFMMKEFINFSAWRMANVWMDIVYNSINPTLQVGSELIEMLKNEYHFK